MMDAMHFGLGPEGIKFKTLKPKIKTRETGAHRRARRLAGNGLCPITNIVYVHHLFCEGVAGNKPEVTFRADLADHDVGTVDCCHQ